MRGYGDRMTVLRHITEAQDELVWQGEGYWWNEGVRTRKQSWGVAAHVALLEFHFVQKASCSSDG